jgi:hypothetical protein
MSRHEGHAELNWFLEELGGIKDAEKYRKRDRKPKREKGSVILVMGLMDSGGFESVKDSRGGCEERPRSLSVVGDQDKFGTENGKQGTDTDSLRRFQPAPPSTRNEGARSILSLLSPCQKEAPPLHHVLVRPALGI